MKKLFLSAGMVLALSGALRAQDCATGYCPATITVRHIGGLISPVTATITYGVVATSLSGTQQCWITRNLGATTQATAYNDLTATSAGWFWQFNRKQGYSFSTGSQVPNTTWITTIAENSNWVAANDPCTLLLGTTWRIPTFTEFTTTFSTGIGSYLEPATYNSTLKFHTSGFINSSGVPNNGGTASTGYFWNSTQSSTTQCTTVQTYNGGGGNSSVWSKSAALPIRCLRTY